LNCQKSAEAIVSLSTGEGPNIRGSENLKDS